MKKVAWMWSPQLQLFVMYNVVRLMWIAHQAFSHVPPTVTAL